MDCTTPAYSFRQEAFGRLRLGRSRLLAVGGCCLVQLWGQTQEVFPEVPLAVEDKSQGKMINLSTSKMKAILAAIVLMMYVWFLVYLKSIYLRNKRLDEIMAVALKTERELLNVHTLDKKLAMQMAQVDRLYGDY